MKNYLFQPHNKRFPDMWRFIKQHINFKDKVLLDLGCGYGDLLLHARQAGSTVFGIENDPAIVLTLCEMKLTIIAEDIDRLILENLNLWDFGHDINVDIAACMSVLPYLNDPDAALDYLRQIAPTVILEVQYAGDGPGFDFIKNDIDMLMWLSEYWKYPTVMGRTFVSGRNKYRTVWLCESCSEKES